MSATPVTINCVIYPKGRAAGDQPIPAVLVGTAYITGLGVGGGPIIPPDAGGGVGDPHPEHPIVLPGDPSWPPTEPPPDIVPPAEGKPPPPEGGWGWSPQYGWGYFPGPGGAGPKRK